MARKSKQITAVIHIPENGAAMRHLEKSLSDFYISQVEKRLQHLPKEQKLELIERLIELPQE